MARGGGDRRDGTRQTGRRIRRVRPASIVAAAACAGLIKPARCSSATSWRRARAGSLIDVLRADEVFNDQGSNLEACGRVMAVAERLISIALMIRVLQRRPSALGSMAFITDGPLALFGQPAKLKRPLLRLLQTITLQLADEGLPAPVTVGIEKSGKFYDHGVAIADQIPERHLMLPDDDYIKRWITNPKGPFGKDTYYGKHFFYRSAAGAIFTVSVPPLRTLGEEPHTVDDPAAFPTLRATCELLDRIGTRLYANATIPVVLAHDHAAYPLETAGHVLKLHAEEHLDGTEAIA
jgi:hypothetical protein